MTQSRVPTDKEIVDLDLKKLFDNVEGTKNYKTLLINFSSLKDEIINDKVTDTTIAEWFLEGNRMVSMGTAAYGYHLRQQLGVLKQISAIEQETGISCKKFDVNNEDHMVKLEKLKESTNPALEEFKKVLFPLNLTNNGVDLKCHIMNIMTKKAKKWSKFMAKNWTQELIKTYANRALLVQSVVSFISAAVTFNTLRTIHTSKHRKLTTQLQNLIEASLNNIEKDIQSISDKFLGHAHDGNVNIPHNEMKKIHIQLRKISEKLEKLKTLIIYQKSKDEQNMQNAKNLRNGSLWGGFLGVLNVGIYASLAANPILWVAGGVALMNFTNAAIAQDKIDDIAKILEKWNSLENKVYELTKKIKNIKENKAYEKWEIDYEAAMEENIEIQKNNDIKEIRSFFTKYGIIKYYTFFVKKCGYTKLETILKKDNLNKLKSLGLKIGECEEILEGFIKYEKEKKLKQKKLVEQSKKLKNKSILHQQLKNLMRISGNAAGGYLFLQYLEKTWGNATMMQHGFPELCAVLGFTMAGEVFNKYITQSNQHEE